MNNGNANFELVTINSALMEKQIVDEILDCNEETKQYGLVFNEKQALALAQTRTSALKENKRIEFKGGIVEKLILSFEDSPYISQDNFESILHELIDLFYEIKNSTWDMISDKDLIEFMKAAFNNECCGPVELLSGQVMRLSEHIHRGGNIKEFKLREN